MCLNDLVTLLTMPSQIFDRFTWFSFEQVSSSSYKSCSSLYSLVYFSIERSLLVASIIVLINSRIYSSCYSRALLSTDTNLAIFSVSSTTLFIINPSYSCLSCDSALLQSCSFGKSVSSSLSRTPMLSWRDLT